MAKKVKPVDDQAEGTAMVSETVLEYGVEVERDEPGQSWIAEVGTDEGLARMYAEVTGGKVLVREVLVCEWAILEP